jgi:hypothetical protein
MATTPQPTLTARQRYDALVDKALADLEAKQQAGIAPTIAEMNGARRLLAERDRHEQAERLQQLMDG